MIKFLISFKWRLLLRHKHKSKNNLRRTELTVLYCMHCFPTYFKRGNFSAWYTYLLFLLDVDEYTSTASSPLCDVNGPCSNIRGSYLYSCRFKFDYSGNGKTCKGLRSLESRDSSVVSSQKGVTLLCEFSLLGDKVFLLRSNSTGNLIQNAKNQLQYAKGLLTSML